jgi:hypothetical protein
MNEAFLTFFHLGLLVYHHRVQSTKLLLGELTCHVNVSQSDQTTDANPNASQ